MCCHNNSLYKGTGSSDCACQYKTNSDFLSRKKRIEVLKKNLAGLEEKADDLREFIKELENGK